MGEAQSGEELIDLNRKHISANFLHPMCGVGRRGVGGGRSDPKRARKTTIGKMVPRAGKAIRTRGLAGNRGGGVGRKSDKYGANKGGGEVKKIYDSRGHFKHGTPLPNPKTYSPFDMTDRN